MRMSVWAGNSEGDGTLFWVAQVLEHKCRDNKVVCRWSEYPNTLDVHVQS